MNVRSRPARMLGVSVGLGLSLAVCTTALAAIAAPSGTPGEVEAKTKLTKLSQDPYQNPEAYHQTELGADTYAFGDTVVSVFQTGRFRDGGADNVGFATTVDAGKTWTHGFMPGTTEFADPPGPYARSNNPSIAYDAKHDVWLAQSSAVDPGTGLSSLLVNRSTDGGLSWREAVVLAAPPSGGSYVRGWITCDNWPTSPHRGNCYSGVPGIGTALSMFTSTNGGRAWSEASLPYASSLAPQPVVQPDGTVVVTYEADPGIFSVVSEDGGATYTGPYFVAEAVYPTGFVPFMRTYIHPSSEVDDEGNVYVVWQDCAFREDCARNDIIMSTSGDGQTWTDVVRIPIDGVDGTVDPFAPGLAVDRSTGGGSAHLALSYYYLPTNDCTERTCRLFAGYISSTDGGATWSKPQKVLGPIKLDWLPFIESTVSPGRFVGDYNSMSIMNGRAFPVLSNAKKGNCELGQVASCNQFMVAPTRGLAVRGGTTPLGPERPISRERDDVGPRLANDG